MKTTLVRVRREDSQRRKPCDGKGRDENEQPQAKKCQKPPETEKGMNVILDDECKPLSKRTGTW